MSPEVTWIPLGELGNDVHILGGIAHSAVGSTGEIAVHSIRSLRDGLEPVGFINLPTSRYGDEFVVRPGDSLLSLDNPGKRNILFAEDGMPPCTVTQQILILRVQDRTVIDPGFLFTWLSGPSFQRDLTRFSTGAAMPRVARDAVLRLAIPVPALEDQIRIGTRFQQLEDTADAHRRTAAKIVQLRDLELTELSALFQIETARN